MQKYTRFIDIPPSACYLGSTGEDGCLDDDTTEHIDAAYKPAFYVDDDGVTHYFDIG